MIHSVQFEGSFPQYTQLPAPSLPEFAFWGRSNVGKSSLINMLVNRKKIAHTSRRPGRTQSFNLFRVNNAWRIVDLPGIGYARVPKSIRQHWQRNIQKYVSERLSLRGMIYLIDLRIPPQIIDLQVLHYLLTNTSSLLIAATKTDKLSKNQRIRHIQQLKEAFRTHLPVIPQLIITSATQQLGRGTILAWIYERLAAPAE